jgi:hypothetical protein
VVRLQGHLPCSYSTPRVTYSRVFFTMSTSSFMAEKTLHTNIHTTTYSHLLHNKFTHIHYLITPLLHTYLLHTNFLHTYLLHTNLLHNYLLHTNLLHTKLLPNTSLSQLFLLFFTTLLISHYFYSQLLLLDLSSYNTIKPLQ